MRISWLAPPEPARPTPRWCRWPWPLCGRGFHHHAHGGAADAYLQDIVQLKLGIELLGLDVGRQIINLILLLGRWTADHQSLPWLDREMADHQSLPWALSWSPAVLLPQLSVLWLSHRLLYHKQIQLALHSAVPQTNSACFTLCCATNKWNSSSSEMYTSVLNSLVNHVNSKFKFVPLKDAVSRAGHHLKDSSYTVVYCPNIYISCQPRLSDKREITTFLGAGC